MLLLAPGCLKVDFSEKDDSFSTDAAELDFPSGSEITESTMASGTYPETISHGITVASNKSWRAEIISDTPDADLSWVKLSESEHLNISNVTQRTSLELSAARNKSKDSREAILVFTRPDGTTKQYAFSQKGTVPEARKPVVYSAKGKLKDIDNIRGEAADTCIIKVDCNTSWKAAIIRNETTASTTLLNTSGTDNALITLRFKAITASPDVRTAVLVFTPEGCKSDTVRFTQVKR